MWMDANYDTTPLTRPPAVVKPYTDRGQTPFAERPVEFRAQTAPVSSPLVETTNQSDGSATMTTEERHLSASRPNLPQESVFEEQVVKARDARLALLAKQYESRSTREDDARMEILTERMRRLVPSVTPGAIAQLEAVVGRVEQTAAKLDDIKRRYAIQ